MKMLMLFLLLAATAQAAPVASWYGEKHRGRITASGQRFNPDRLTAASWKHPLGTRLLVTHGGRSVRVVVNDRGPARRLKREIDLSRAAFARLADPDRGLIRVKIERLP
jgi:rare lipoprotein A